MATFKIAKVVLSHLFKTPATKISKEAPIIKKEWKEITRGHIEIDKEQCILCGMCMRKCPTDAITVDKGSSTWQIQRMQCIQCGCCAEVCPKKCLEMKPEYTDPNTEKVIDVVEVPKQEKAAPKAAAGAAAAPAAAEGAADGVNIVQEDCVYCGLCAKNCPVDAITVDRANKEWSIDRDSCVQCGMCVDNCPKNCLSMGAAPAGDAPAEAEAPAEAPAEEAPAEEAKGGPLTGDGPEGICIDVDTCVLCGLCAKNCPVDAISVDRDSRSWSIDRDACVLCGMCIENCPKDSLDMGGTAGDSFTVPA